MATKFNWKEELALAHTLLDLPKEVFWCLGRQVTQLVIRETESGWQVIVKTDYRGRQEAAYVSGRTFLEAVESAVRALETDSVSWYPDKYPPRRPWKPGPPRQEKLPSPLF